MSRHRRPLKSVERTPGCGRAAYKPRDSRPYGRRGADAQRNTADASGSCTAHGATHEAPLPEPARVHPLPPQWHAAMTHTRVQSAVGGRKRRAATLYRWHPAVCSGAFQSGGAQINHAKVNDTVLKAMCAAGMSSDTVRAARVCACRAIQRVGVVAPVVRVRHELYTVNPHNGARCRASTY